MKKVINYLTNPTTRISLLVFMFWLWVVWSSTNSRISTLEEKYNEVDTVKVQMYEIQTTLGQIQTDILWIKQYLVK